MPDLCTQSITERTATIEDALAKALDLNGIAIEYDKTDAELVVADPGMMDVFLHHDLWAIARDLERRLFPNG